VSVFEWIRTRVRDAVLGGFSDDAAALNDADDVPALLLEHRRPDDAPADDAPAARRKRA
jgi:hypothetical protein